MGRNYSATAVDTTLAAAITSTATTFSVMGTVGLPTPPFAAAIIDSPGSQEVVLVTGMAGTTLTVTRGYDSTTAAAHPGTAVFRHVATAADFRDAQQHVDATTGVHGVGAGAVVGTSTTQTLTNKNLTSGTNTFPTFITGYLVPTGVGMEWHSTAAAPTGWLLQDGGEYPIATYTALYNFLTSNGTVFPYGANTNGSGAAGSTHFRTPNHKGRVGVGVSTDTEFNALGKQSGTRTETLTLSQIPAHSHGGNTGFENTAFYHNAYGAEGWFVKIGSAGDGGFATVQNYSVQNSGGPYSFTLASRTHTVNANHVHPISPEGGGGSHNNVQPSIAVNYIIKT